MRCLLDTVTFIWAVAAPERISKKALRVLQATHAVREISVVSVCEIAIKQTKGKLVFPRDAVITGIADLKLRVLPFTADHSYSLFNLPLHHIDPFDRQLIAQALIEEIPIVTCDEKFRLYKDIRVIW